MTQETSKKKRKKGRDKNNNNNNNRRGRILSSGQAIQRDSSHTCRPIKKRWPLVRNGHLRLNSLPWDSHRKEPSSGRLERGGKAERRSQSLRLFLSDRRWMVVAAFVWRWCGKPVGFICPGINNRLYNKELEPAHYLLDCQVVLLSSGGAPSKQLSLTLWK